MPQAGQVVAGRYRLEARLGSGAAAEVWRAEDTRLGRQVAVKILRAEYSDEPEARGRFAREARAAAALRHPNVVDVYDYGSVGDLTYIVMQYIDGLDLKRLIRERGPLAVHEAVRIAGDVARGLEVAHRHGLIHRDIKPQNILVDRSGGVHITDFGIAKALGGPSLTTRGLTYGTAAYLSPEQATGQPIGPASDVYALGIVLYEMLCGEPPFNGENAAAVAYQQVHEPPPPLAACAPGVPPAVAAVVSRALAKDPALRYPSASAFAADLQHYLATRDRTTPPILAAMETDYGLPAPPPPAPAQPQAAAHPALPYDLTTPVAVTAAPTRRGGNLSPWLALPLLAVILLGCGVGAWGMGLIRINMAGATPTRPPGPTASALIVLPPVSPTALPPAALPPTPRPPAATPTAAAGEPTRPPSAPPAPTSAPPHPTVAPPTAPQPSPTSSRGRPVFPTPTVPTANGQQVTLEDTAFTGGYRYQPPSVYEGRTAVWIYGPGSGFSAMQAPFAVAGQPGGTARLTIAGMDSEGAAKTPLRILINGQPLYDGPNPLPNDYAPNPGNWGTYTWTFDAALLLPGRNSLALENRAASGKVGAPPFIMLDNARLEWDAEQ